jgi:hypothetical protein
MVWLVMYLLIGQEVMACGGAIGPQFQDAHPPCCAREHLEHLERLPRPPEKAGIRCRVQVCTPYASGIGPIGHRGGRCPIDPIGPIYPIGSMRARVPDALESRPLCGNAIGARMPHNGWNGSGAVRIAKAPMN